MLHFIFDAGSVVYN